jgi:hypothetical protein
MSNPAGMLGPNHCHHQVQVKETKQNKKTGETLLVDKASC